MQTKVSNKSKELSSILESHLNGKINRARIKFMALMILALCKVQTVSFERLAQGFECDSKKESSLRRIQRFMAGYMLDMDLIARMIFSLLPHRPTYRLVMDATNWKFGQTPINILVLAIAYKGVSFPILYRMMPKKGSSNYRERIELMERYISLFGKETIRELLADREFIGHKWLEYLNRNSIRYYIRITNSYYAMHTINGKRIRAYQLFEGLKINQCKYLSKLYYVNDQLCYLSAMRFVNDKGSDDLLIIISFKQQRNACKEYAKRWQIESMFRAIKSSGFNIERTHLSDIKRFEKLLTLVFIAFVWAYLTGLYIHKNVRKIRMLKHGFNAKSFFKYGLDYIAHWLLSPYRKYNINPNKFLSCT